MGAMCHEARRGEGTSSEEVRIQGSLLLAGQWKG